MNEVRWYKKPEMLIAFSALLISLITAVISVYSAYIDRSYARASIWPRLEIYKSQYDGHFSYNVSNNGNGPALIQYAIIKYKSKPIQRWSDIPDLPAITQSHIGRRILSSQKEIVPIIYNGTESYKFKKIHQNVSIELCYCSIYNECWLINTINLPKSVDNCEVDEKLIFLQ